MPVISFQVTHRLILEPFLIQLSPRTWACLWMAAQVAKPRKYASQQSLQLWAGASVLASCMKQLVLTSRRELPTLEPRVLFQKYMRVETTLLPFSMALTCQALRRQCMYIITPWSNRWKESTARGCASVHVNMETDARATSTTRRSALPPFAFTSLLAVLIAELQPHPLT